MPIYEYACRSCTHRFERLVRGTPATPACPACGSADLQRLLSLPAVRSEGTRARALKAARQRDARLANERVNTQREYEANHDD